MKKNLADMLTKVVPGVKFKHCKKLLHILPVAWARWRSFIELWMAWSLRQGVRK